MRRVYAVFDDATEFELAPVSPGEAAQFKPIVSIPVYWWEESGGLHVWPYPILDLNIRVEDLP